MIRTTVRTARKSHQCGGCLGRVKRGERYRDGAVSPNHGDIGNLRWERIVECGGCAERYGRPL